jgi:hypothetical protein
VKVGNYTSDQLSSGINLALLNTPMTKQAREVLEGITKHTTLHEMRLHSIQVGLQDANTEALKRLIQPMLEALSSEEAYVVSKERVQAQPIEHHYEVFEADPPPTPQISAVKP